MIMYQLRKIQWEIQAKRLAKAKRITHPYTQTIVTKSGETKKVTHHKDEKQREESIKKILSNVS